MLLQFLHNEGMQLLLVASSIPPKELVDGNITLPAPMRDYLEWWPWYFTKVLGDLENPVGHGFLADALLIASVIASRLIAIGSNNPS